jgi:hypothetical protein
LTWNFFILYYYEIAPLPGILFSPNSILNSWVVPHERSKTLEKKFEVDEKQNTQGRCTRWADHFLYSWLFSKTLIFGCRGLRSVPKCAKTTLIHFISGMRHGVQKMTVRVRGVFLIHRSTLLYTYFSLFEEFKGQKLSKMTKIS